MQLPAVSFVSFTSSGLRSSRSFIVLGSLHAAVLASSLLTSPAGADPFDAPGHPVASGVTWASQVEILVRGPLDIANPGLGSASAGDAANTLGPATGISTDTVTLGDGGSITLSFDLPKQFHNSNVMVEILAGSQTRSQANYANSLAVQVVANYGHVKVAHADSGKPLAKVYVKVYARMADGRVRFYKDGYTDLRGRFDYSSLNTNELDFVRKFSLLILSETAGAVVREADPPKR